MPNLSRRFDPYMPQVNADKLKKMVRTYGGDSKMRKQECVDFLLAALSEPEMVRKAIENLEPFEQLSLPCAIETAHTLQLPCGRWPNKR
jgi:hypothetical protein